MRYIIYIVLPLLFWGCYNASESAGLEGDMENTNSAEEAKVALIPESVEKAKRAASENIIVFISKGSTQCNDDGISHKDSALTLINKGLDVLSTQCGHSTGLVYIAVCGGPTSDIIAHQIRRVSLAEAEKVGYRPVETLINEEVGLGYKLAQCSLD